MNKLLLLLALLFCKSFLYAQSQNDYPYTIGFGVLSIGEYPKLMNEARKSDNYKTSTFNTVLIKFNDNQISYRISASRTSDDDYSFTNNCSTCEIVKGKYKDFNVNLGFEKNIIYGVFQPYYGIELGYKSVNFDGQINDASTNVYQNDVLVEKTGGVIYPFLGVKLNLLKAKLTLNAETGIDIFYSYDKETKSNAANNSISLNHFNRWGFNNRPLGMLGLQYNFGDQ